MTFMREERRFQISDFFRVSGPRSLYAYSLLIGALTGGGALLFSYGLAYAEHIILHGVAGMMLTHPAGEFHFKPYNFSGPNAWILLILPAAGGLVGGIFTNIFCKEARGTGTDALITAFHQDEGRLSSRVPFAKAFATIATLATGGSAGKEGPTAQIGAGIGSFLARLNNSGARARRTLLLAGTAAGLGAIFRAPFGGAMTAIEVLYQEDFETDSMIPCIISSVTGYLVYTSVAGAGSVFSVQKVAMASYYEIFFYLALAGLCFLLGNLFIYLFNKIDHFFIKLKAPNWLKPALGAIVVGISGAVFPEVLGSGFGFLQTLMDGKTPELSAPLLASFFLLVAIFKIIATTFTIGSGGSGGIFGPSLFIGALLGGFIATLAEIFFPEMKIDRTAFLLVGMGSFFSGVAHAPIAGMLMVCDMAGTYALLPPLMITSILAIIFSGHRSIYSGQLRNRFQSPAHLWDMNLDVLETLIVKYFIKSDTKPVSNAMPLLKLEEYAESVDESDFVLKDSSDKYAGMLYLKRIHYTQRISFPDHPVSEFAKNVPAIDPNDSLGKALQLMLKHNVETIAILDSCRIAGTIRHHDIFNIYNQNRRRSD